MIRNTIYQIMLDLVSLYFILLLYTIFIFRMQNQQFNNKQQVQVGIEQYLVKGKQLKGITKFLISDFVVNEVDLDHKVVVFKDKPNLEMYEKLNNENKIAKEQEQAVDIYVIGQEKKKLIIQKLGQDIFNKIQELYERLEIKQKISDWKVKFQGPESKIQRTELHNFIRENLSYIDSRTDNGQITLTYTKTFKRVKKNGQYIHFKLFKSNIDTMNAVYKLSKILGLSQKLFGTAGLKDKRGITTQKVSVYNCQKQVFNRFYKVASRNKQLWIGQFEEGHPQSLGIGDLIGNKFGLIIRFIEKRQQIQQALQQNIKGLKQFGFINYFGMQRFGRGNIRTHQIGIQILKKNWKYVIQSLLLQDVQDQEINRLKKELYENRQYKKAERQLPNRYQIQKNLFYGLSKHGQNYSVVFESLPRSSRMIYGHALQSYIWNKVVSERIRKYGNQLQLGDMVAKNKIKAEKPKQQELDQIIQEQIIEQQYEVELINQQNKSKYSIFDVVVPIYGAKTQIPQQSLVKGLFQKELLLLGLSLESFIKGMPKSLYLQGGYRKMLSRPEELSYTFTNYCKKNEELQNGFYYLEQDKDLKQGNLFALKIRFILLKSSYATMVLREILKIPSSFNIQQILNKMYANLSQN